jgi:MoaA/NifB/PqqE/SkfB family radical SAM enzyme
MEVILEPARQVPTVQSTSEKDQYIVQGWERIFTRYRMRLHIFFLALKNYRSLRVAVKAARQLLAFKKMVYGGNDNLKLVRSGRKYLFDIYAPAFPSRAFNHFIEGELNRAVPLKKKTNALSFIFFAITRKCPLQCEHCFEWDNLNKKESFTLDELKAVVHHFQEQGLAQFHLSGGEPLVRFRDLEALISTSGKQSEFWVLTSGFHLTEENANRLKAAGTAGIVISLDHYEAEQHDAFRGLPGAYQWAMNGIRHAKNAGLTVCLTVCVTRAFATRENLLAYQKLARSLGVSFVQILEPKPVGHYRNKAVTLSWQQLQMLEAFYTEMNFDPAYRNYPVVIYHGYHQRRTGCFAAGDRNLYLDSDGYVHACPFCQTKNYHIKEVLGTQLQMPETDACPLYT